VVREYGGPDVLKQEAVQIDLPGQGQVRVRQRFLGVNYHDIYVRSGFYKTLALPGVPGCEAVGVVEAVGAGVTNVREGGHIAYITDKYGGCASERLLQADLAVKVAPGIDERTLGGAFLRGLTVDMLVSRVHRLQPGDWALVHAAAGGVGRMLAQWASHIGAHVIGTAGSPEKAVIARRSGCEHMILYRQENFVDQVKDITAGRGVGVAYDSVGKGTFLGSLD